MAQPNARRTRRAAAAPPACAEHIAAECAHDLDRALATFERAHDHVDPLGLDAPGYQAVRDMLSTVFNAFPDFEFVAERTDHASDAVIVEGRIRGTHNGDWAGIAPTGRAVDIPTCCLYHFDADRLMSETVYFDHATLLTQIAPRCSSEPQRDSERPDASSSSARMRIARGPTP